MRLRLLALAACLSAPLPALADGGSNILGGGGGGGGGGGNVSIVGPLGTSTAPASAVSVSCVSGCQAGSVSNATSGVAATATNSGAVSWTYGWNAGTSKWDQLQVDANDNLKVVNLQAGAILGPTNGTYANLLQGNVVLSATNGIFSNILQGNAVLSAANGLFSNIVIAGAAQSATNGQYANILQGNAALSATNGLYVNLLQGNSVIGSGNPIFAQITNGIVGTNSGVACGTSCTIGVQGNVTATDVPVSVAGTGNNTGSAFSSSATNIKAMGFLYGYNGASWDQLQVDGAKLLKINCAAGCGGAGTVSNATSALANSATNVGSVSYLYGYNGASWDQLRDVSNVGSAVTSTNFNLAVSSFNYGYNGASWDQLQVDASKFLKVNCAVGCSGGSVSNLSSGLATSSTNVGSVSYLYGFNGTTWDQLRDVSNASSGVATSLFSLGVVSYNYAFNGTTWDQIKNISNSGSGASSTNFNLATVSYNYGYNGATWDQLQVDANKSLITVLKQGAAVLGATNGIYSNLLQGNAALSVTNGIYSNILQGNAVLSAANPLFVTPGTGATFVAIGASSNASSGVATSSVNSNTIAYNYAYNGATWDQMLATSGYLTTQVNITNPTQTFNRPATAVTETPSTTTGQCASPFVFTKTGAQVFVTGQQIIFTVAPCATTGPAINTPYYVTDATTTLMHLSTTPSNANNIAGSGTANSSTATLVYASGNIIANNATAGSVAYGTITASRTSAGSFYLSKVKLTTTGTGSGSTWGGAPIQVNLWSAAATYTNGDGQPYAVATGAANYLGSFVCTLIQFGDGASCTAPPITGSEEAIALASGTTISWDLQYLGSSFSTPGASQTFTLGLQDWRQ